jgi:signal transduction histidine kinase
MSKLKLGRQTPSWRLVYLALAGFDLVTVLISLSLSHSVMSTFRESVAINTAWVQHVGEIRQLRNLAEDVNAPANDVFASMDVPAERQRRNEALATFNAHFDQVRYKLAQHTGLDDQRNFEGAFATIRTSLDDMTSEAGQVFLSFELQRPAIAGQHMAAMDKAYGRLTKGISATLVTLEEIESQHLQRQLATADSVRNLEFLIGGLILLMVTGTTIYGYNLGKVMRRQTQAVENARIAAEAANEAKSNFLASMSHEIRTPMNGILGMAQSLDTGDLPAKEREKVSVILDSGASLLAILNDVLDFSKIEAGKFDICPAPNDIVHTVDRVVRLFETHARDKDITLAVRHDDDIPRTLAYDAERVRQCISNLVSNALKFTPGVRQPGQKAWSSLR